MLHAAQSIFLIGAALATSAEGDGWVELSRDARCVVLARSRPGTDVQEMRVSGIVRAPAWVLRNVVDDIEGYPALIPYTTATRVLSRDTGGVLSWQRLEMPFLQRREYVVHMTTMERVATDGRRTMTSAWRGVTAAHRGLIGRDAIGIELNDGSWTFEELEGPEGPTRATFTLLVDPAGSVPTSFSNAAQRFALPRYLDNLERRAADPKYRLRPRSIADALPRVVR